MSYADQGVAPIPDPIPANASQKIKGPDDKWSDDYARRVVRSDFAYAESYRTHAHDWRYRNAAELYLAWAGQRFWEGTRVPRSSLGIYVVFAQVESMLPKIVGAICDPENYNFYANRSDQEDAALAWRRLVLDQLEEINYREHIRRCAKSSLIYGNGILELGFEDYMSESVEFSEAYRPKRMGILPHPIMGNVPMPIETEKHYSRRTHREKKSRPYLRYVSLIDFYVNPNCESTLLQVPDNYVIKRQYMSVEQVAALRGNKAFNIPDDATLSQYSHAKTTANQDVTKLSSELFRYNLWNPALDYSGDPAQKRLEIIEYTTRDRKVWLLSRDHVAYNQPNRYGEINYYSMHYADVLDRWHALAISDIAEGEQRLQQSIINARVDELALSIHRPMVKRRGVTIPPYQLKVRPGVVIEAENPDADIKQLEVQNITQQAYVEAEASERRTQRLTGMSDLAAVGAPTSGGNSASRTATGVNTQASATQDRVRYYIENAESLLVEPVLNALIRYNKKFLDIQQAVNWMALDPDFKKLKPVDVMNAQVRAECRASIKLAARTGFLQVFPQLAQTFLNPEFLQMIAEHSHKTVDAEELGRMLLDAINYAPRNPLIIDLTQEQIQARQQPPPEAQLKALLAGKQQESDERVHSSMNITKLVNTYVKEAMAHHKGMAELDDKHLQHGAEMNMRQAELDSAGDSGEG